MSEKAPWITYRPQLKVLDCTVRDGGLINNHLFSDEFVRAVYDTCIAAGIDYMEVGYKNSARLFPKGEFAGPATWRGVLPLPGQGLEGVELADQRELFTEVLKRDRLTPETFRIDGVPGFVFKAEERPIMVLPRDLRVRRHESGDRGGVGRAALELSFGLPRGSYAT